MLLDYGVDYVFTGNDYWVDDPDTYAMVIMLDGKIRGGVRFEHAVPGKNLPLQKSIQKEYPLINTLVAEKTTSRTGELCGLWLDKEFTKQKLSLLLVRTGLAQSFSTGATSVFCLTASYMEWAMHELGFINIKDFGTDGRFPYPTDEYRAGIWIHEGLDFLINVDTDSARRVSSLILEPKQKLVETDLNPPIEIEYEVHI